MANAYDLTVAQEHLLRRLAQGCVGRFVVKCENGRRRSVTPTVGTTGFGGFLLKDATEHTLATVNSLSRKGLLWLEVYEVNDEFGTRLSVQEFGATKAGTETLAIFDSLAKEK